MKNRLSDGAGYKTFAIVIDGIENIATIRRLPLRPMDNESRYRVRLVKATRTGEILSNTFRDMDIAKAYRVYEQNRERLAALAAA